MITEYKITGPLPVCGKQPGQRVSAELVPDAPLLVGLGWLVPVESGTASSTIEKPVKSQPVKEKS